ncbi:MAG: UvrD-helicase domain-containing protein [Frankiaceae bacterium]
MSTSVVLSDLFGRTYDDLDGSLKSRVMDFVVKLQRHPHSPGLDLKQPSGVRDRRVRTARVNDSWRAVLLALPDAAGFILVAVKPHDEAYDYAGSLVASVNEVTGALELLQTERLDLALQRSAEPERATAGPLLSSVRKRDLLRFGISNPVADQLLLIAEEDKLLEVADALPRSQGDAVLDLYSGLTPDEVWTNLVADEPAGAVDRDDVAAALARPLSRLSFTDLSGADGVDELRAVFEGSLAAWRVWLHPLQRRLATHDGWNGPYRVTGGAGTGKTVTALHRARHLVRRADGRVLFTTFTRNLADTLRLQLVQLAGPTTAAGVDVLNLDALALRVLRSSDAGRALVERVDLVGNTDEAVQALWAAARSPTDAWDTGFLQSEWSEVVLAHQITTEAGYLAVSRSGRGQRLSRPQRAALWRIFERFGQLLRAQGLTTFTQMVSEAALLLASDDTVRASLGYSHAVIDEAQDLHPAHWRMLRALVPAGPDDLFLVGDAHQRIYGRPLPLTRFGIETRGRSRRLTVNYRTSRQILRWSLRAVEAETDDLDGGTDTLAGARSLFDGPEPTLAGYPSAAQETTALVSQVSNWIREGLAAGEIAVFVREGRLAVDIVRALATAEVPTVEVTARDDRSDGDVVRVMTMHRAKGLEFRAIALSRLGVAEFPPPFVRSLPEDEARDAERIERNLLYVAASRARERLWVSWVGHPSILLPASAP